jgi:hypothetical protein
MVERKACSLSSTLCNMTMGNIAQVELGSVAVKVTCTTLAARPHARCAESDRWRQDSKICIFNSLLS